MARIHAAIAERAGQQLGLLRRTDLDDIGLTRKQIRTALASTVLQPVGPKVFRHAGFKPSREQALLAAAWTAGPGAVVSHLAAATLWGLDGVQTDAVELSVPLGRNPRIDDVRVHRVRDLAAVDRAHRGLIPVTTPARTLFDCAATLAQGALEEALDGACRRGLLDVRFLRWRLDELRRSGRPGVAQLDALLRRPARACKEESWLESAFVRLLMDAGLPLPRIQVHVRTVAGGKRYRLDGSYDDADLVVEVDGHATHATRRQRQADAERDARLVAAGLRVVRFTYEDVTERPEYVATTIATLLGLRALV